MDYFHCLPTLYTVYKYIGSKCLKNISLILLLSDVSKLDHVIIKWNDFLYKPIFLHIFS